MLEAPDEAAFVGPQNWMISVPNNTMRLDRC
jgi:hypothetical protein